MSADVHRTLNPLGDDAWCGAPEGDVTFVDAEVTCKICAAVQQFGGEITMIRHDHVGSFSFSLEIEHVGPDRHDEVPYGCRCRCGWTHL